VDVNRLSRGEKIAGAAALLLLIDMFLNWYSLNISGALSDAASRAGIDTSVDAWQAFSTTDLLIFLTVLAALTMVGLRVMGRSANLPVSVPLVVAALGAITTLLVLWRIVNQPGENDFINVEYGAYLGLILLAVLTYGAIEAGGGVDTMRAEAESLGDRATTPAPAGPSEPAASPSFAEPAGPPPPAAPATPATAVTDPAPPPQPPTPTPPSPAPDPAPPPPAPDPAPTPAPEPEPPTPPAPAPDPPAGGPAGPTVVHDEDEPSPPPAPGAA
jgi:outer membrane biosynthesis protein TonB